MYPWVFKDEHSKKVLGWAVADRLCTALVLGALNMAVAEGTVILRSSQEPASDQRPRPPTDRTRSRLLTSCRCIPMTKK